MGLRDWFRRKDTGVMLSEPGGMASDPIKGRARVAVPEPAAQVVCVKDFPRGARFTARMVEVSRVDPEWHTYSRAQRRALGRATRLHGDGRVRQGFR